MAEPSDLPPTKTQSDSPDAIPSAVGGDTLPTPGTPRPNQPDAPPFRPSEHAGDLGRLGRYRVLRRLGAGGMGAVYLAFDEGLRRRAALKVMLPRYAAVPSARERFLREARTCARVRSEHVVTIHDVGEERGVPFIAMEYLLGSPLDQFLKTKGDLALAQALRVVRETAVGLSAAHARGLIHRDIKPGNIWLEAPKGRVKILDFGLARPVDDEHLTGSGAVMGTPAYMAPEQARGEPVDARADVFALGGILATILTARPPFAGASAVEAIVRAARAALDDVFASLDRCGADDELVALAKRCLAPRPEEPPASGEAVAGAMAAYRVGVTPGSRRFEMNRVPL